MSQFKGSKAGGISSDSGKGQLLVLCRPSFHWMRPTYIREGNCFPQSTNLNVKVTYKQHHRNTENNVCLDSCQADTNLIIRRSLLITRSFLLWGDFTLPGFRGSDGLVLRKS